MEQNLDGFSRWIKPTDPTPHPITLFLKRLYSIKLATWKQEKFTQSVTWFLLVLKRLDLVDKSDIEDFWVEGRLAFIDLVNKGIFREMEP